MSHSFHPVSIKETDQSYIRVRWSFHGTETRSTLGFKIPAAAWDLDKEHITATNHNITPAEANELNKMLDILSGLIEKAEQIHSTESFKSAELKNLLRQLIDEAILETESFRTGRKQHRILPTYEQFIEQMFVRRNWTKATRQNYKKLIPYLEKTSLNRTVENIDIRWVEDFYKITASALTERTTLNMMTCLRSFLRWCIEEYGTSKDCLMFSYKTRKNVKDMVYLTSDELHRLVNLQFSEAVNGYDTNELEAVRDMFLFCCLTGLRFSDMQRLEWIHIYKNSIKIHTKKTMKLVEVELNPLSRQLISRYDTGESEGFVFPRIENGRMNKVLKVIGEKIELDTCINRLYYRHGKREEDTITKAQALTTHTGRHTFAVQALSSGVPGSVVMAWTGHSDYDSLKPYMDITSDAKRKAMDKFENYMKDVFVKTQ